ncbi:cell division protein FtsQ [soil metagenome]
MKKFKYKIDFKKVLRISMRVLIIVGFLASVGFTEHRRSGMQCKEISITVDDSLGNNFVQKEDISQLIGDKFGKLTGKPLGSINISLLEKIIDGNPFVLKAQVFSTVDGKLVIEVKQRTPIVRVINNFHESFYIDDCGILMPMSEKFSAHVPVANGNIFNRETEQKIRRITGKEISDTSFSPTLLEKIFMVSDFVHTHEFWNAQIEQIFVDAAGDMELIPRVGNQTILFGDEKQMEEKFNKLYTFYKEGLSKTGWNQYKTINVTFKDQVVCSK